MTGDKSNIEIDNDDINNVNTEESSESKSNLSALQENISKKGKNSYYYAHGNKIDGPVWDGKEEPRKLNELSIQSVQPPTNNISSIIEYSWADGSNNVNIYIDFNNVSDITDENISLSFTSSSIEFKFKSEDKENALIISDLYENIDKATFKKKSNKFVITLTKAVATAWISLKKT